MLIGWMPAAFSGRSVSRQAGVVVSRAVLAWRVVYCLACVVAWRFSADVCGGEPCRVAYCLVCVVASHAVLTVRAGEGGGLILPALAKSAPTLPSPPRHPGTARCAVGLAGGRKPGCTSTAAMPPLSGAGAA